MQQSSISKMTFKSNKLNKQIHLWNVFKQVTNIFQRLNCIMSTYELKYSRCNSNEAVKAGRAVWWRGGGAVGRFCAHTPIPLTSIYAYKYIQTYIHMQVRQLINTPSDADFQLHTHKHTHMKQKQVNKGSWQQQQDSVWITDKM